MLNKITIVFLLCLNLGNECIKGDPGRDLCKIVSGPGLKCSKILSNYFPYDAFLSFNDDIAQFTTEMKFLEITRSNISVLQTRSFQRTPYLSHILLSDIFLIEIEPGAFEGLRRLKLVDLSQNLIQKIPLDTFKHTKINRLILDNNAFLEIPSDGPILNAKYLTSLSLKNCNIQNLSSSAFQQTLALLHLDLSKNYLESLPSDIFLNLDHLKSIDLSGNKFRALELKVFESMSFFPSYPTSVILADNPWMCDCKIAKLGHWLTQNVENGAWTDESRLSRLKKTVECHEPKGLNWNSAQFRDFISSC